VLAVADLGSQAVGAVRGNKQQFGTVLGGDRCEGWLDGVLAEEDGGSAEGGVEGLEGVAGTEALVFGERVIARQDEFSVHVLQLAGDVERGAVVGDAVVELGETEEHGGVPGADGYRSQALVGGGEAELRRCEVAAEVELRKDDQLGALGYRLGGQFPSAVEIRLELSDDWGNLTDGDLHHRKSTSVSATLVGWSYGEK